MANVSFVARVDGASIRRRDVNGAATEITLVVDRYVAGVISERGRARSHVHVTVSRVVDRALWADLVAAAERIGGRGRGVRSVESFSISGVSYVYDTARGAEGVSRVRRVR